MQIEWSKKNTSLGMLFMFGCGLCFVAVIGLVRNLDGALPAAQASFIRADLPELGPSGGKGHDGIGVEGVAGEERKGEGRVEGRV